MLVGADGLRSMVRRLALPQMPQPVFNGLIGSGSIVDVPCVPSTDGLMKMIFGRRAFFGYIKHGDGPVYWFDSFPSTSEIVAHDDPAALIERLVPDAPILESISVVFGFAASWALGVGVFVLLFRYLPDSRTPWRAALIGAATTTVLVAVGTSAIGYYLRTFGGSSVTGATGGAVLLLLWIYYEAQIVLVGAEFTRVVAIERLGSPVRAPAPLHDQPPNETETRR
jgi:hypothetical protein